MKEPIHSLTGNSTLNSIIEHYEWMLKEGKILVGGAAHSRLKELKEKRWEAWKTKVYEYGKHYAKEPDR